MSGYTDEEILLNRLGAGSFLKFWSWPSLFRDQGDSNKYGDGKEICDLVVIFGNDIILFSDKKIKFNQSSDVNIAWARWARKAIGDSVKQIKGARRWFEEFPDRIYIDKKCKNRIPIKIPSKEEIKFHNVVVCHGIENILSSFNSEASFIFDNSIVGAAHWNQLEVKPFYIGQIFEGDFVHIFNESTIMLALQEFDTAKDFIQYLDQRKSLLSANKHVMVNSESDIMQLHYESFDENLEERSIWSEDLKNAQKIILKRGGIEELLTHPSLIAKKEADKISYFWDDLINVFSHHILNDTAEHKNWENPIDVEPGVRFLASTCRFERRILAEAFKAFYEKALPGQRGTRLFSDYFNEGNAYLFFFLPDTSNNISNDEYRGVRRQMLQDYCLINKYLDRSLKVLIGVAAKTREEGQVLSRDFFNHGQDFLVFHFDEWSDEDYINAEVVYKEYVSSGLLAERFKSIKRSNEFPDEVAMSKLKIDLKGSQRNLPCVCGSGKKIKNCCAEI